ncbi:Tim44 domain-containing protein [Azospirillaceae bacterium]
MNDGFYFIDIVIFAMVAGFLVYRLRSVLGRRHGEERSRPNPFAAPPSPGGLPDSHLPDNVIPLPDRNARLQQQPPEFLPAPESDLPQSLEANLARVRMADPNFDEKAFLRGARNAFEVIIAAFADGNLETLRPLLSDEVYNHFASAVRSRIAAGETLETRLERICEVELLEAKLFKLTAFITLKFTSNQVNVTRSADGAILEGAPNHAVEVIDLWTFARNTGSQDPNWTLVETRIPN